MTSSFSEHSRALDFPHVKEKSTNKKQNTHKVKQKKIVWRQNQNNIQKKRGREEQGGKMGGRKPKS